MKRRSFCSTAAGGLLGVLLSPAGTAAAPGPRHVVSLSQVERALGTRFPVRLDVAGLFNLDLQTPRLRLVPQENRLRSEMVIEAGGEALRHRYSGLFDLDFLLRYEAADQTLRAHRPRVHALRLDNLPPRPAELLTLYGPSLAEQALHGLVLHRLEPRDLALADTMGLEPDTITVSDKGLVIAFKPKPLRAAP